MPMTESHTILHEYRCYVSGRLLCKAAGDIQIEIMNPVNRIMNYVGPTRLDQDIGPKGAEFSGKCVHLNCQKCTRLLAKAIGVDGVCEIRCRYCKTDSFFDLEKLQRTGMNTRHKAAKEIFRQSVNTTTDKQLDDLKNANAEKKEGLKEKAQEAQEALLKAKTWGPDRFKTASF